MIPLYTFGSARELGGGHRPNLEIVSWFNPEYNDWEWGNVAQTAGDVVVLGPESLYKYGREFRHIEGSESHKAVVQTYQGGLFGVMEGHIVSPTGRVRRLPLVELTNGDTAADVPDVTIGEPVDLLGMTQVNDPVVAVWFDTKKKGGMPGEIMAGKGHIVLPVAPPFTQFWRQVMNAIRLP